MARLKAIDPDRASGATKELFETVSQRLGMVPNLMRTMANAPSVLDAYLQFGDALSRGTLSPRIRERIGLAVAQANGCDYCLAAHSAIGTMVGLTADQIRDSRLGTAIDPKIDVLIRFAQRVVDSRARLTDEDVREVRAAGYDDGTIAEVVANVALEMFTNYFNIVAETEIDFPSVPALPREFHAAK